MTTKVSVVLAFVVLTAMIFALVLRVEKLERQTKTVSVPVPVPVPVPSNENERLDRLEEDINVCHDRVDDVFWALEVVSRVEGPRSRAPTVTKRVRPKK